MVEVDAVVERIALVQGQLRMRSRQYGAQRNGKQVNAFDSTAPRRLATA